MAATDITPSAAAQAQSRRARRLAQAAVAVTIAEAIDVIESPVGLAAGEIVPAEVIAPLEPTTAADRKSELAADAMPAAAEVPTKAQQSCAFEDAFSQASDAFGFSAISDEADGDNAKDGESVRMADEPVVVGAAPASTHVAPRRRRRGRLVAAAASVGVMGIAGLIAVSMTVPASAVAALQGNSTAQVSSVVAPAGASATKVQEDEIQAFVASDVVQADAVTREGEFSTVSLIDVAAEENITFSDSLYTNDPNAAIQWPFMVGVAMSSPYGMRNGRMHAGIDLVPGNGATIQAIADGTVRIATESGGAYGVTAYVDHIIDGQVVTSHYSHMQYGSLAVKPGQKVKVGDTIGKVGNTGRSYGAHLHFEIIINGSTVDPLPWMRDNAGRTSY